MSMLAPRRTPPALTEVGPARWDEVVTAHPGATAFHRAAFLTTAAGCLGLRVHLTLAEADGAVVGAVPLLLRGRGPVALVNSGLPIPYLGPLLPDGFPLEDLLVAVRRFLRPAVVLELGVETVDPLRARPGRGWAVEDGYDSALVPVKDRDEDALLAGFDRDQRANVRKGRRKGLETGPATREEVAGHLAAWAAAPLARQGLPPRWPDGAQLALYDALAPAGVAVSTAVRRDGELIGVTLDLLHGDRLVGWESGLAESGRALNAAPVLHLAVMGRARDLGAAELDMLGSPNPGIARYKRGLGAEFRPRGFARWSTPLLPWARRLPSLLARGGDR